MAEEMGVQADYILVDTPQDPAIGLAELAEREGASEIMVSHKGRKLFKIIPVGSVAFSLIAVSPRPVLIVKPRPLGDGKVSASYEDGSGGEALFRKILVAIDHDASEDMMRYVAELAARARPEEVYIVHVVEPRGDEAAGKRLVASARDVFSERGVDARTLIISSSKPWRDILGAARQLGITCIIAGRSARRTLLGVVLGSNVKKLVEEGHIPVLVYPLGEKEA